MRSHIRKLLLALLFLSVLTGFRLIWMHVFAEPPHPPLEQGVLDLRGWDFQQNRSIRLNGEWEFYPNQLLDAKETAPSSDAVMLQVPGDWREAMPDQSPFGYGTYRLRILVDGTIDQPYALWIKRIKTASQVFVNGKKLGGFGQPAFSNEQYEPRVQSYMMTVTSEGVKELEVVIHAANFDDPRSGGSVFTIRFGSEAAIDTEWMYTVGFQFMTIVIMLLHALYAAIVWMISRSQRMIPSMVAVLVLAALSIAVSDETLLHIWFPMSYEWTGRLSLFVYICLSFFMLQVVGRMFPTDRLDRTLIRFCGWFVLGYAILALVAPLQLVLSNYWLFSLGYFAPAILMMLLMFKLLVRKVEDIEFLLLAATSVMSSIIWGSIVVRVGGQSDFYPVDMIAAVVGFSTFWFKQYFRKAEQNAELTERLKREDRLKDEFLANTSHELRTPLHGIMNIAHSVMVEEKHRLKEKSYKDLQLLETISRRMSYTLNDLLDLSQLKENRIALRQEAVKVQSVANGVLDMVGYLAEGKPIALRMDIPPSFPAVWADEKRLVQILFNLVHNAIKFTSEGRIVVTAEEVDGMALIRVTDTGIGLTPEVQKRIFVPYEQAVPGGTAEGIGLGLSICRKLAELHGGEIGVRSTPGEGAEFTFTLPLARGTAAPPIDALTAAALDELADNRASERVLTVAPATNSVWHDVSAPPGALRVLIVDDDPVNLKVLANMLQPDGYALSFAASGEQAAGQLSSAHWDLFIIDVMMTPMSGYELTRLVRERFPISELPILLLTARSGPEDIYTGFLAGANDYVTKPADALELRSRVRSLISVKRSFEERLRMEAAYLQAQIRPHFLFNTLNSIMALGDIDTDKMNELIHAFSMYLRISFDFLNAEQLVPLEHELTLVRSYLYIEQERFDDRLRIEWELETERNVMLPPLSIQPLVENAVKHGALGRLEGGTVRIRITEEESAVTVSIADDGSGMSPETIDRLFADERRLGEGIGMYNTHRRLKQAYGEGLHVDSRQGEGTTVSFRIPIPGPGESMPV